MHTPEEIEIVARAIEERLPAWSIQGYPPGEVPYRHWAAGIITALDQYREGKAEAMGNLFRAVDAEAREFVRSLRMTAPPSKDPKP